MQFMFLINVFNHGFRLHKSTSIFNQKNGGMSFIFIMKIISYKADLDLLNFIPNLMRDVACQNSTTIKND